MYTEQAAPAGIVRPPDPAFKIEAVIICNEYADFLRQTLPHNKQFFDRVVVVTTPEDKATQRVCEFYHVQCIKSKRLRPNSKHFCKGAGINDGLADLSKDGWVLHLDADIWLPPQFRNVLTLANLGKKHVYGIDRFNVKGWDAWQQFLEDLPLQHEAETYVHVDRAEVPVGARIMQRHMGGWLPIGFFQLWHPAGSGVLKYPEGHTDAGREDCLFANYWPRSHRSFIPEVIGYHLESTDAGYGMNWSGRKSAPFGHKKKAPSFWRRVRNRLKSLTFS